MYAGVTNYFIRGSSELSISFNDVCRYPAQGIGLVVEPAQAVHGFFVQFTGTLFCTFQAEESRVGRFLE